MSLVIWDHTTYYLTQVNTPHLNPSQTVFDLVTLKMQERTGTCGTKLQGWNTQDCIFDGATYSSPAFNRTLDLPTPEGWKAKLT